MSNWSRNQVHKFLNTFVRDIRITEVFCVHIQILLTEGLAYLLTMNNLVTFGQPGETSICC